MLKLLLKCSWTYLTQAVEMLLNRFLEFSWKYIKRALEMLLTMPLNCSWTGLESILRRLLRWFYLFEFIFLMYIYVCVWLHVFRWNEKLTCWEVERKWGSKRLRLWGWEAERSRWNDRELSITKICIRTYIYILFMECITCCLFNSYIWIDIYGIYI